MFHVIVEGLKFNLRQKKWVLFNALFPIFLMVLLGVMLSNTNSINSENEVINICYYNESGKDEIINEIKDNVFNYEDFSIKEVSSVKEGKTKVENEREIFLLLKDESIETYYSEKSVSEGATVLSYLKSFSDTYASINELYMVDVDKASHIISSEEFMNDSIDVKFIKEEDAPNSYQYYGIVEVTMMMLYVTLFPIGLLGLEKSSGIKDRIILTGLSDFKYFIGRIISSLILSIIIITPGFLFSLFKLKSNWGDNPLITFMYLIAAALMMVTLGTFVGYAVKQRDRAALFLQGLIIPVFSFLGGSYISLPLEMDGIFNLVTNISPLRWLNKGIFKAAYEGSYYCLNVSLVISITVTITLFYCLYICIRREKREV